MCSFPVPPRFPNVVVLIRSESLGETALGTWFLHLPASFPTLPSFSLESLLHWHLGQCVGALCFPHIFFSVNVCHCHCWQVVSPYLELFLKLRFAFILSLLETLSWSFGPRLTCWCWSRSLLSLFVPFLTLSLTCSFPNVIPFPEHKTLQNLSTYWNCLCNSRLVPNHYFLGLFLCQLNVMGFWEGGV